MTQQRMTFSIDRHTVTEGDIVEITWQCDGADSVWLTIDNGFKTTDIPLDISGTKRFRLNRSKGRTKLMIHANIGGNRYSKSLRVRVKKMPTVRAETVDQQGRRQGALKQWWQKQMTKWHDFRGRLKYSLNALPERKQMAVKMLVILGLVLIISAIWPRLYSIALPLVVIYLTIVLLKR